jgi:hypothetical protein
MAKVKVKIEPDIQAQVDQEFPTQLLYTSPPEAASLKEWLREIESGHGDESSQTGNSNWTRHKE